MTRLPSIDPDCLVMSFSCAFFHLAKCIFFATINSEAWISLRAFRLNRSALPRRFIPSRRGDALKAAASFFVLFHHKFSIYKGKEHQL